MAESGMRSATIRCRIEITFLMDEKCHKTLWSRDNISYLKGARERMSQVQAMERMWWSFCLVLVSGQRSTRKGSKHRSYSGHSCS
ncbi:hypothetical protein Bca101_004038 [Brassica carinata]